MTLEEHVANIAAAPDDEGGYLVLADWLQERGDPWGKLIVLQHQLEHEPGNDVVSAAIDKLLRKHRADWLADLYNKPEVVLEWRWGFVREVRVLAGYDDFTPAIGELLASPVCHLLDSLIHFNGRGRWQDQDEMTARWKTVARERTRFEIVEPISELGDQDPLAVRWLVNPDLDALPVTLAELPNLEWLELNIHGDATVPDYAMLPRLRRLDVDYVQNPAFLPEQVFALPQLAHISMYENELGPAYNMGQINALLSGFLRARTPTTRRIIESRLLVGDEARALELATDEQLLAALDNNVKAVNEAALRCLEARLANPLEEKPLEKGDVVARLGSLYIDKDVLKQRLEAREVKLTTRVNAKTTHALIGNKPNGKQLGLEIPILCQAHVKPLLVGETVETSLDVAAMLVSKDAEAIAAAVKELQRLGGVPPELLPELLYVHQDTSIKGRPRAEAKKLFKAFAPPLLKEAVTRLMKTSILLAGETKRAERLEELERDAGAVFDVVRFAEILVDKERQGIVYFLERNDEARTEWLLGKLRCGDELDLSGQELRVVPKALGGCSGLRTFRASANHLTKIGPEILSLTDLEELDLGYNRLRRLPAAIAALGNLKRLKLGCNCFATFPVELTALDGLEELDLGAENYGRDIFITELPADIGALKRLRRLDLGAQRLESFPDAFFELERFEELHLMSARLPPPPPALARLPLRHLDVRYSSWADGASRATLATLLPDCTIV